MDVQALHAALLRPETYPSEEGPIRFVETHVSRLYFSPVHVYKFKKPIDFGFLNFTTLDRRRFYCEEEVLLNRRFAPGTYLGVVDVRRRDGAYRIGGEGEIVDYAVMMKRLPAERMLDRLLDEGRDLGPEMEQIGARIAALHRESAVCRNDGGQANVDVVRFNWRENFNQSRPFAGRTLVDGLLEHATAFVEAFLAEHAPLLREREAQGWVRDGHGDLHAEHICLTEPVRIYDCIEFNRRFRVADVAADIAFLVMDLEFRGRRDLAQTLLKVYKRAMREGADFDLLLPFYTLYRAWVRGKVESFLAFDGGAPPEVRHAAAERARRYFDLSAGYLCPPLLILIGGLMGTGKSTLGRALAQPLRANVLRSDVLRKELATDCAAGAGAPFGSGLYAAEFTRRTYEQLLQKSLKALDGGRTVIVDASFSRQEQREPFLRKGRERGIPILFLLAECDRATALERLEKRQALGEDPSDGRPELYDLQAAAFEIPGDEALRIDTGRSVPDNVHRILTTILDRIGTRR